MPIDDNQPDWIRELYRDIYPQAPIYPVGQRNIQGPQVSGWQGRRRPNVPMFSQPDPNAAQPIPDDLMGGGTQLPMSPTQPLISSGQISDDATSLLGRVPLGQGQDVARFLQSPEYRQFRGIGGAAPPTPPTIRPPALPLGQPPAPTPQGSIMGFLNSVRDSNIQRRRAAQARRGRLGPSVAFSDPNRPVPPNERPVNPLNLSEMLEYLFEGNR